MMKDYIHALRQVFICLISLSFVVSSVGFGQEDSRSRRGQMPPIVSEGISPNATRPPGQAYILPDTQPEGGYPLDDYDLEALPTPTSIPLTFEEMIFQRGESYGKLREVISPDTLLLRNGYRLKLFGVKGPDPKKHGPEKVQEARSFLRFLIGARSFSIKPGSFPALEEGQLTAWVYLPGIGTINEEMLRQGYATVDTSDSMSDETLDRLQKAQKQARERQIGIWEISEKQRRLTPRPTPAPLDFSGDETETLSLPTPGVPAAKNYPDRVILVTGEQIEGRIENGDTQDTQVTIRTPQGYLLAVPRHRVERIEKVKRGL